MSVIVNFCLPFRGSPVPVRENPVLEPQVSRDESVADLPDLFQELIRMDVEGAMFKANYKMYEHERLRESMEEFAKEWRRGFPERD